jgi:hypothetical protein
VKPEKFSGVKPPSESSDPPALRETPPDPAIKARPKSPAPLVDARKQLLQAKRYRARRPVRLAEAMRNTGLDEHAVAAGYADVLAKLQQGDVNDTVEKSLLDVLKECARILDPPRPADRAASIDVNTVVQLVHKVDRPTRPLPQRLQAAEPEPPVEAAIEPIPAADLCSSPLQG